MKAKYHQIKEYLLENIRSGAYQPNQAIPPERELAATLGVNRMTVRRAIEELMYEGLLTRKKGSGTFLTQAKRTKSDYFPPTDSNRDSVRILSCQQQDEGNFGLSVLHLQEGQSYWRLRRVRMTDLTPYAYEDIYFHPDFFPKVDRSLYSMSLHQLVLQCGLSGVTVYQDVEALLCLQNTARLLKVEIGSPILQIKTCFERNEHVVLFCRSYHPGDNYKYHSEKTSL